MVTTEQILDIPDDCDGYSSTMMGAASGVVVGKIGGTHVLFSPLPVFTTPTPILASVEVQNDSIIFSSLFPTQVHTRRLERNT